MQIIFFIKSATVNISKYTIKDIPGSSGRLDVISRCILAAILDRDHFEKKIQIWISLDKYGIFMFNPKFLIYEKFPKNEISLANYFTELIKKKNSKNEIIQNPLNSVKKSKLNAIQILKLLINLKYNIFILSETGDDFFELLPEIKSKKKAVFIIGSQTGEFINSKELLELNLPTLSLGKQSYLASSIIRLLKLHIRAL
ncbi:MAG: hypothetical protein ACFFA6_14590 [Promethearchaeota archaeon]